MSMSLTSYNSLKNFGLGLEDCGLSLGLEGSGLINIPGGQSVFCSWCIGRQQTDAAAVMDADC